MDARLRLTPFEHFMLLDDRLGWPMTFWVRLSLDGALDRERLDSAMVAVQQRFPLLSATVARDRRGRPIWSLGAALRKVLDVSPTADGELPATAAINLERESGFRVYLRQGAGEAELLLEFHHCVCDGIAALEATAELLGHYRDPRATTLRGSAAPDRAALDARLNCGEFSTWRESLRQWWWMANRGGAFFATAPACLQRSREAVAEFHPTSLATIDLGEVEAFRAAARSAGATINDLLLQNVFLALRDVASDVPGRRRLFVPMNLRTAVDPRGRGVNMCGMVHIDDTTSADAGPEALLRDVSQTMKRNRQVRAGRVYLCALAAATRLLGSPRAMVVPNRCGVTSVVSNLGLAFPRSPLVDEHGAIDLGGATLRNVVFVPPVRWLTPCTIGIVSYGGRISLGLHYQCMAFSHEQAAELATRLRRHAAACLTASPVG